MNTFFKVVWINLVAMTIVFLCSLFINWTLNRNGFQVMVTWFSFLFLGLFAGRTLTEKEMRK